MQRTKHVMFGTLGAFLVAGALAVACSSGGGGTMILCDTDAECAASGLHCDTGSGFCVGCLTAAHCGGGTVCLRQYCQQPMACSSPTGCTGGLKCDAVGGYCVECLSPSDCTGGKQCVSGSCVSQSATCTPNTTFCSGNSVAVCSGDGQSTSIVESCGTGTCTATASGAFCEQNTGSGGSGGTGGDPSTGGSVGTGGDPGTGGTGGTVTCMGSLIDDMDQGLEGGILPCEGRMGGWYAFNDGYCSQEPSPLTDPFPYSSPGAEGVGNAIRTYGSCEAALEAWGAGIGFDLNNTGSTEYTKSPYNASGQGYRGLRFWAKLGSTLSSGRYVTVSFPDRYTDPIGGYCYTGCYADWQYSVYVTTTWGQFDVPFSLLSPHPYIEPEYYFDPTGIMSVHFRFQPGEMFDLWIDNVSFY